MTSDRPESRIDGEGRCPVGCRVALVPNCRKPPSQPSAHKREREHCLHGLRGRRRVPPWRSRKQSVAFSFTPMLTEAGDDGNSAT
jgi:hypothetical protein